MLQNGAVHAESVLLANILPSAEMQMSKVRNQGFVMQNIKIK